jgi:phosphatidylglycerophosphatase C
MGRGGAAAPLADLTGSTADAVTGPGLAVFDFDGTLIQGDSLLPFLERVVGRTRARLSLVRALRIAFTLRARGRLTEMDTRTAAKAILLRETLTGIPAAEARAAADRMLTWVRWKAPIREALFEHQRAGRHILVATGALGLYMPRLLEGLPVDGLLATDVEEVDGLLTGHMPHGNCVRSIKATRFAAYLRDKGPFGPTWGYGNRPSDLPMLALVDHPTVV